MKERVEEGLCKEVGVGGLFCKVSNVEGFGSVLRVYGGRTLVRPSRQLEGHSRRQCTGEGGKEGGRKGGREEGRKGGARYKLDMQIEDIL